MKIVAVSDWISEKMGYSEKSSAESIGQTWELKSIWSLQICSHTFPITKPMKIFSDLIQPVGTTKINGFTSHRLPHASQAHGVRIKGFHWKLAEIRPDIVQSFVIPTWSTYHAAVSKLRLGYKLFLEEHTHASVLKLNWKDKAFYKVFRLSAGKVLSVLSERCYAIPPLVLPAEQGDVLADAVFPDPILDR
jgi:hypothetical protein